MPSRPKLLPTPLRSLVRVVETALGDVIREAEGNDLFDAIEEIRRPMVRFREAGRAAGRRAALHKARLRLDRFDASKQTKLARAYTLYLELINVCENAYRTHRLRSRTSNDDRKPSQADAIFVLTAHPTESRSPQNIQLLRRLQERLVDACDRGMDPDPEALRYHLHLLWRLGTHPHHRPTVADEARHLYSLVSDPILEELIDLEGAGRTVRLRSWSGAPAEVGWVDSSCLGWGSRC